MGWTAEKEQREAIARKAQDAYALARQAIEKAEAALAEVRELRAENERLRGLLADRSVPVSTTEFLGGPRRRKAA